MSQATVDQLLAELDAIIAKIRTVRTGDFVLPEDHNLQTDAIKKIREILEQIKAQLGQIAVPLEEPDWSGYQYVKRIMLKEVIENETLSWGYNCRIFFSGNNVIVIWTYLTSNVSDWYLLFFVRIPDGELVGKVSTRNKLFAMCDGYYPEQDFTLSLIERKVLGFSNSKYDYWFVYNYKGLQLLYNAKDEMLSALENLGYVPAIRVYIPFALAVSPNGEYIAKCVVGSTLGPPIEVCIMVDLYRAYK